MQNRCYNCMSKLTENDKVCPFCGEALESSTPAHRLLPGTVLNGKYLIGRVIGEGGFGITYIGIDTVLDIKIAVKEYFPKGLINRNNTYDSCAIPNASDDDNAEYNKGLERFLSEARILAKFTGENGIVTVRDYFEENNTAYIVMEYIDGVSLSEYLSVHKRISEEETLQYMLPLMESLKKVHSENLIHRDISPENIMLANGKTVLIDFGASRVSSAVDKNGHSVYLKDGYAPLEQYSEQGNQGPWTDIYSLAATMYRCVTGKTPLNATLRYYGQKIKKPSEINKKDVFSERFENAIVKALSVNYKDRFQSIDDFIKALPSVEDYKETVKKATNTSDTVKQPKNKVRTITVVSVLLVLIIVVISCCLIISNKNRSESNQTTNNLSEVATTPDNMATINNEKLNWAVAGNGFIYADGYYFYNYSYLDEIYTDKKSKIIQTDGKNDIVLVEGEDDEDYSYFNYLDNCLYYCTDKSVCKYDLKEKKNEVLFTTDNYLFFLWVNSDYYIFADTRYIYKKTFDGDVEKLFDSYDLGYKVAILVDSFDENGIDLTASVRQEFDISYKNIRYDFNTNTYEVKEHLSKTGEKLSWYHTDELNDGRSFFGNYTIQCKTDDEEITTNNFYYNETLIYSYVDNEDENGWNVLGLYNNKLVFYKYDINHNLHSICVLDSSGNIKELSSDETNIHYIPDGFQTDGYIISRNEFYYEGSSTDIFDVFNINDVI